MKKITRKTITALTGASMLLSSTVVQAEAGVAVNAPDVEENLVEYKKLANVEGSFAYNQDKITPADDMFNIFGTVVTGACAKPAFVTEAAEANVFINVGGKIKKSFTVNLNELSDKEEKTVMSCFCATSPASANVEITGIRMEDVLSLAELAEDVNTITVRGEDGYGMAMPLTYVLEHKAMIVYKVNGEKIPSGTQFWVPSTVAKYFTRNIMEIELSASEMLPEVEQRADDLRAEIAISNKAEEAFNFGEEIAFEGYADDLGSPIAAIEFSLDGGETWTTFETADTKVEKWVYWNFSFIPEEKGDYQLIARAKTADGTVSPLAASVAFSVK